MVFFSCDGCAEVLKKSQVDGHARRCRNCASVSCVDCLVKFYGDDFRAHTSCLTEVERYEKKDPSKRRTKQTPQEAWMSLLADSASQAPPALRHHLSEISARDNVPRKEKQFRNFVANSMKISKNVVDEIWNFLKELKEKQQAEAAAAAAEAEKPTKKSENTKADQVEDDSSKDKNVEAKDTVDSSKEKESASPSKDNILSADEVKKAMKKILKKEKNKAMPVKNLRKAVCAMYGLEKKGKKHMKNLIKQHLSGKKFVMDGKVVKLKVD